MLAGATVKLLFGGGEIDVTRMGFVDATRSSIAPAEIYCRMMFITL